MNKDYLEDAQGRQVPLSIIKPMDLKRHEAVMSIMKETFAERERLIEFKRGIWLRVQDFLAESAKDSGARKFGGKKGNVTLTSYDGKYKVIVAVNDTIQFNEKLQIAKQLIDKCIASWSEGVNENLRAIVDDAFNFRSRCRSHKFHPLPYCSNSMEQSYHTKNSYLFRLCGCIQHP